MPVEHCEAITRKNMFKDIPVNTSDIEFAVANRFSWQQKLIVPNISWGMGFQHELDLIVVSLTSFYADEVEIKISVSDLRADKKKKHNHFSTRIRRLYFAMPTTMAGSIDLVPENAGIMLVSSDLRVEMVRAPKINKAARALTETEMLKLLHLASMRVWTLKKAARDKRKLSEQRRRESRNEL